MAKLSNGFAIYANIKAIQLEVVWKQVWNVAVAESLFVHLLYVIVGSCIWR